jgi:fused signal recognition particle receptor
MAPSESTLGRLFRGLGRTRESLTQKLKGIVTGGTRIDEHLLERVEAALLLSDVGPTLTSEVIRVLRQSSSDERSAAGRSGESRPRADEEDSGGRSRPAPAAAATGARGHSSSWE